MYNIHLYKDYGDEGEVEQIISAPHFSLFRKKDVILVSIYYTYLITEGVEYRLSKYNGGYHRILITDSSCNEVVLENAPG